MAQIGMMMKGEVKELKALLISDIHVHGGYLNKLALWLSETKTEYDVVLLAGNLANMVNKQRKDYVSECQASEQVIDTLNFFMEHVKKPVIYVPGNTEPSATYTYQLDIPSAVNAHKRAIQLDDNLVIVGLGGSAPIQKEGKDILEGFPYQKDDEYTKELNACFDTAMKTFGPNADYILLTHMGPAEAETTEAYLGNDKLNVGSKGLGEMIKKNSANLLCNIHGHSSLGEGISKPYTPSLPIINPGGLTAGRFGELRLARMITGRWKVASVMFHNLE